MNSSARNTVLSTRRSPERRGACPSLQSPMETGDGLLARLRPVAAGQHPADWKRLAALSLAHGNGLMDVTARGNLQIRGLTADSARALVQDLADAGLESHTGLAIEIPPLSGLDPGEVADAAPVAARLRERVRTKATALRLAPKLTIVVDGGGAISLAAQVADIRLDAMQRGGDLLWRVALGGDAASARPLALLATDQALDKVLDVLKVLDAAGPRTRGRDLDAALLADLSLSGLENARGYSGRSSAPVGPLALGGLSAFGLRLPFGRVEADRLDPFLDGLMALGATELRLSPGHALLVLGLSPEAMDEVAPLALKAGFITDPDDPRNAILACPGERGCASGLLDPAALSELLTAQAPALFDGSVAVHLSGCAKGCSHPAAAPLTLAGTEAGIAFVLSGRAGDVPAGIVHPDRIGAVLARLNASIAKNRTAGATALETLSRIDPASIRALIEDET